MGYRNYLYKIPKKNAKELRGLTKQQIIQKYSEDEGYASFHKILVENNAECIFAYGKLYWDDTTLVTRSKAKSKGPNLITKGIRTFEVYNAYGGSVIVEYQNENEVLYTTHEDLIKQYFEERNINIYGK